MEIGGQTLLHCGFGVDREALTVEPSVDELPVVLGLVVQREQIVFQLGLFRENPSAVSGQYGQTATMRGGTTRHQPAEPTHVLRRHSRATQTNQQLEEGDLPRRVPPTPVGPPVHRRKQALALVPSERVLTEPCRCGDVGYPQILSLTTHRCGHGYDGTSWSALQRKSARGNTR